MSACCAVALFAAPPPMARAHHNTETMIARFTERIEAGESSAELFYRRAIEYRVLRKHTEAEADLRRALERDPDFVPARAALARSLSRRGESEAALSAAHEAVAAASTEPQRAASLILVSRLLAENAELDAALHACESALKLRPRGEVEWFLLQSEVLGRLGRGSERPAALRAGHAATGSVVLRNAWVDAVLDDGRSEEVEAIIEEELASSRLKSSWLLRRARARTVTGDNQGAAEDLQRCLDELAGRIHPARPDITLVADRGLAHALLGNATAAKADLARARAAGADHWVTAPLERALLEIVGEQ